MRPRTRSPLLAPTLLLAAGAFLAGPAPSQPLHAQEARSDTLLTVQHYMEWERFQDPRISPDGSTIVYTRGWVNAVDDRWDSELWIMDADGSRHRFLTKGSGARWSPDGTRIAYLAPGDPEGAQIHVRWMDAEGATSQVTRVDRTPGSLAWSPDGGSIAFVMMVPDRERWSVDLPPPPEGANWTAPPHIEDRLHYRQDFRGFLPRGHNHLFVVPADGGAPRQLTEGKWHVGARSLGLDFGAGLDWTPDSRAIVFDGLMEEDWEERYLESHLYRVDVDTREVRQLTRERGPWSGPVVSPDGRWIAFTGHEWTVQTYRARELYLMGPDGSGVRRISGDLDRDPSQYRWAPDGSGLYFTADDHGSRNVHFASVQGQVRQVTEGTHMLSLASLSNTGRAALTRSDPHDPGSQVRLDLAGGGEIRTLARSNRSRLADIRLGEVEEIWYESGDGTPIQGWIVKPPSFDPDRRYPMLLEIHGGPHAMYNVGFSYAFQNFAANGYLVLYTNPRGSTGYGTDFGNAIDDGYPSVDHDDLMAGVDALLERGYVDPERLYVGGCSGGGVLSSWAIGQTDRFAAAAVRCPVVNWISFAGTSDVVLWGYHRYRGFPWENPDRWLEHSPLMYVGNVTTPTLLMTGELDLRTPMAQTEEYYQALRLLGVPVVMMRFQGEYHGTGSKPSNFMRTQLYMMSWFERYGPGGAAADGR